VLYGDTDSVFIDAGLALDCNYEEAQQAGASLCVQVDRALKNHLEERYGLESRLELEFEKYYERFLLPPMRGSEKGRAKGYAGWLVDAQGGRLEIIGMEAVRRDWTALAQKLQRRLLELLFSNARVGEIEACVSEWVRSLRAGERDDELVYHKSLRKPVSEYTRNVPPHVQAAKMLPKPRGVIHYVVTHEGPQPLGHLCGRPDYDHYVEKQIEPLVRTIAQVYPIDLDATIKGVGNLFAADVWLGTKERTRVQKTESLESFGEASHE
jgi:DNA polymerase-2